MTDISTTSAYLKETEDGLVLTDGNSMLKPDFLHMLPRLRTANLRQELLIKAAKNKKAEGVQKIVDATAGLGDDSLLLAAAGFEVELCEANPIIAALLRDALERSKDHPQLGSITARMHLYEGNSIDYMAAMTGRVDAILLDPMFPERQKSALVRKKFQLIHQIEQPCQNEEELLEAALRAEPKKIIIKRPLKGPFLAGKKPSYSLKGKAIRYDVILVASEG